ncbi:N-lysine methyltransferase SMYD2-A-like [Uloborus diversus]|uniref:N-lysine methyltransferase SMYD2-A-like n=1 Tax=Uloborus diversus TaxID=327109 RepID=UPI00240A2465|nr:N-lysine methyltransferase SMYD2-A-like [Uloborus diversus]
MSKFYKPGDIIYSGKPFAQCVNYELRKLICDNCFRFSPGLLWKLKACCNCRYVYYCGKPCQRESWNRHKLECPLLCNIQEECNKEFVRLTGQVILLLKGKDWKSISEPVGNTEKSFYDLVSNTEHTKNDSKLSLQGLEVLNLVKKYLGKANVSTDDEILEIFGKVKHNVFGVGKDSVLSGSALYLGASLFNHACIPNANRNFQGATIIVRAISNLSQDDVTKVTISYRELLFSDESFKTKDFFYGPCKCDDCSLPYGESKLTKILDKTRAWSVIESTKRALDVLRNLRNFAGKYNLC